MAIVELDDNRIKRKYKDATLLGANQVYVGVQTDEDEIRTRADGYKYVANKVEGQEVYNLAKQKHNPWFALDFETGKRGWCPGFSLSSTFTDPPTNESVAQFVRTSGYTQEQVWYHITVYITYNSEVQTWNCYYPNEYNKDLKYKIGYIIKYRAKKADPYLYYKCKQDVIAPEAFDINKWELIDPITDMIWQNDNLRYA